MGEPPKRNTINEDVSTFQSERTNFLKDQREFKFGYVQYGSVAVAGLRSMYLELVYSTHVEKKPEDAKKYLLELDELYDLAGKLASNPSFKEPKNNVKNPQFLNVVRQLDALHSKLMEYKRECGFG